jgi:hypothetical protein
MTAFYYEMEMLKIFLILRLFMAAYEGLMNCKWMWMGLQDTYKFCCQLEPSLKAISSVRVSFQNDSLCPLLG